MAAGSLAAPGTEFGPCEEPCVHTDCAATRGMAARPCSQCGKPMGYGRLFYQGNSWETVWHMVCRPDEEAFVVVFNDICAYAGDYKGAAGFAPTLETAMLFDTPEDAKRFAETAYTFHDDAEVVKVDRP